MSLIQQVNTISLPTGERSKYPFTHINLIPMSLIDIVYHSDNYNSAGDEYDKFEYMYNLVRRKVKEASRLYLPDIYYMAWLLLTYSISESLDVKIKYTCANDACRALNEAEVKFASVKINKVEQLSFEESFGQDMRVFLTYPTGDRIERFLWKYRPLAVKTKSR